MNDLISVIIPVYNVEEYLEKCVTSVINQTYKNIEIILVDDGSTDKSGIICDKLLNLDSRISVYHKKNGGLSDARNYGIKKSKGKYIQLIDSDDYISNDMIEVLYNNIKNNNCDISICDIQKTYSYTCDRTTNKKEKLKVISNKKNIINSLFINQIVQNYAVNKLYIKELFNEVEYPKGRNYEDISTTFKLFMKAKRIVVSNQKKYYYFQRENSIHKIYSEKNIVDMIEAILYRFNELKNNNFSSNALKKSTNNLFINGYYRILQSKYYNLHNDLKKNGYYNYLLKENNGKIAFFNSLSLKNKCKYILLLIKYKRL